jgi:hypothetical protein
MVVDLAHFSKLKCKGRFTVAKEKLGDVRYGIKAQRSRCKAHLTTLVAEFE